MAIYYQNKLKSLCDIFGTNDVILHSDYLKVKNKEYPIIDDVIILLLPDKYTESINNRLSTRESQLKREHKSDFSKDIQYTFGKEWHQYNKILPEHKNEFFKYFDLIDLNSLKNGRVCDLGCGIGRFSYFLTDICKEIVLVDFSDSIFVARKNLSHSKNCLFFMCDLKELPFKEDFCDFLFCLGVLHHLPTSCLHEVRNLKRCAPKFLIFLYYALDNRKVYFRMILRIVSSIRLRISKIRNTHFRRLFSLWGAIYLYQPLIFLGEMLRPIKMSGFVPLYDAYHGKNISRIEQDVYDRFFTSIEQRVSYKDIMRLHDTFKKVVISDNLPYWHFICER